MKFRRTKTALIAAAAAMTVMTTGVTAMAATSGQTLRVTARSGLNVRSGQGTHTSIITSVGSGARVTCIQDYGNGWIKIRTSGGTVGYVSSSYVTGASGSSSSSRVTATSTSASSSSTSSTGQAVANYALQFLGLPYVWGGESLTSGADCSGFTKAVYAHFGVYLPHYDLYQRAYGTPVASISQARPGDLVFYSGHVAIYIGNGQVISARGKRYGVAITSAWYMNIQAIRRIF